jgi:L-methionine (R)-S-oxide reductase
VNGTDRDSQRAEALNRVREFCLEAKTPEDLQREIVDLMKRELDGYDWVGFYMLDPGDETMLVLGPYAGAATEHVRIPVSEGICGAAVALGETLVIDDVQSDPRYLACSIETKSEIVVPLRVRGRIVGEIDIDSHAPAAFNGADRAFVEECARIVGEWTEKRDEIG